MSKEKKKYKSYYVPKVYEREAVYQLEMEEEDGIISVWYYDKKKSKTGPYKTKQKYLNPKTGKEVSYARAKALGLV